MEYLIQNGELSIMQKLEILTDAAKYDVACTSSGVERKGDGKHMGNCTKAGICHSFSSDGRCISLLKILMTNECIFDCKYCLNRKSNDVPRATFTVFSGSGTTSTDSENNRFSAMVVTMVSRTGE